MLLRAPNSSDSPPSSLRNLKSGTSHAESLGGAQLSESSIEFFTVSPIGPKLSGSATLKSLETLSISPLVP